MLGLGLIARVASGTIADKIGGLAALLIGSTLQAFALLLYLGFNGLTSLYVVSRRCSACSRAASSRCTP